MSTRISHGKRILDLDRLADMGKPAPHEQPTTRAEQNQNNARNRSTKEAVKAPLKAAAGNAVRKALGGKATPEESALVAQNALVLAADAQREIGVSSPFVSNFAVRYGVAVALAGFFVQRASELGFDSPEGLAMLEAAHKCEARSERAMLAADAAVKAFAGKNRKPIDAHAVVLDTFGGKS